jgi:hypothetical protein
MSAEQLRNHLASRPSPLQSASSLGKTFDVPTTSVVRILSRMGYSKSPVDGKWHFITTNAAQRASATQASSFLVDTFNAYVVVIPPTLLDDYLLSHPEALAPEDVSTGDVAKQFISALITLHNRGLLPIRSKITPKGFEPL